MTDDPFTLEFHPLANLFPLIDGPEFTELVEDVRVNGLRLPILVYEGKIIDGRNRYRACLEAGVMPQTVSLDDAADPAAIVKSLNLTRRHLTTAQRAAIAAELMPVFADAARRRQLAGVEADPDQAKGKASAQAAAALNVSPRSVERAAVRLRIDPHAHELAKSGKLAKKRPTARINVQYHKVTVADPEPIKVQHHKIILASPAYVNQPETPPLSEEQARANLREAIAWVAEHLGIEVVIAAAAEGGFIIHPKPAEARADGDTLYCSFCGKSQHMVRKLVKGGHALICDECVALCNSIIDPEQHDHEQVEHEQAEPEAAEPEAAEPYHELSDDELREAIRDHIGDESRRSYATRAAVSELTLKRVLEGTATRINGPTRAKLLAMIGR